MKNILLVTPLYPLPTHDNRTTPVCHYFARDWKRLGYNVIVIHSQHEYPRFWHLLIRFFGKSINHKFDGIFYAKRLNKTEHYTRDDVDVYRIPLFKYLPGPIPAGSLKSFRSEVNKVLKQKGFVPDIIVGHMLNINIIPYINELYSTKTCIVSHGEPIKTERFSNYQQLIASYDIWGFRSIAIKKRFENEYGSVRKSFICYSGIPESFISNRNQHVFGSVITNFLYVGTLIQRKYPSVLPESLNMAYPDKGFKLVYVGDGPEKEHISAEVSKYALQNQVEFKGKIPRGDIIDLYDKADCMIMISRDEAYGLVYLEAMSRGCLVIASRDEGIDGIIIDGENGFLCEAGNAEELISIINRINSLSPSEKQAISDKAITTALKYTDLNAAQMYINSLEL